MNKINFNIILSLFAINTLTAQVFPTDTQLNIVENPSGDIVDKVISEGDFSGDIGILLQG